MTDDFRLDLAAYEDKLGPDVKIVAVTGMSNVLGILPPIRFISDLAHRHGARVVVDAAQLVPHHRSMSRLSVPTSSRSPPTRCWAPPGSACSGARWRRSRRLEPFEGGGEMISDVTLHDATWAEIPHRFEAGTPPIIEAVGLHAAVEYLE